MRAPLFVFSDGRGAARFERWVFDHAEELREQTHRVSRHARLISVEPATMGRMVNLSFVYETGDAAGQNMTTSATWHACQWLLRQIHGLNDLRLENFLIEGAMSGDKKVTFQSLVAGRGTRVTAECFLDRSVLSHVLRVTAEDVLKAHGRGLASSLQVGMIGYNVNAANIVAAIFTATGQDIACVHESSLAQLHLEGTRDGLYASLLLPSLIVGTVGGGTHLPRQNDCLQLMDCAGLGKAARLAEVIAGYCLATDISTTSAIAGGQFAMAHERLGRPRAI
jgi:hydroxymethylglutaryl-CoA reductase